jgi:hypothetical protein
VHAPRKKFLLPGLFLASLVFIVALSSSSSNMVVVGVVVVRVALVNAARVPDEPRAALPLPPQVHEGGSTHDGSHSLCRDEAILGTIREIELERVTGRGCVVRSWSENLVGAIYVAVGDED